MTTILPVLYRNATLSLILRTKHRLGRIQEQDAQEDIWVKREVVICQWRKLHNQELHHLYSTPIIDQIMNEMVVTHDVMEKKPLRKEAIWKIQV
jgi:fatty acid desaturase